MNDLLNSPPERREKILARAEELIRAERAGRFAPDSNQDAADPEGYTRASWVLVFIVAVFAPLMVAVIAQANL